MEDESTAKPMLAIRDLLVSPLASSILNTHPNHISTTEFMLPVPWLPWWDWAADLRADDAENPKWLELVRMYVNEEYESPYMDKFPEELRQLIQDIRRLELCRRPAHIPTGTCSFDDTHGMSPKKAHEVNRMTAYIEHLLASSPSLRSINHVVDVGAGQGYISRALKDHLGLRVLALDSNDAQTTGAERKAAAQQKHRCRNAPKSPVVVESTSTGSIAHKTMHITAETLPLAIDQWISAEAPTDVDELPVLLVALHACGSLTPDILRTFLAQGRGTAWRPAALVVVGCCYNLLAPKDFPLSRALAAAAPPTLTPGHLHVAAQVPAQWLRTPAAHASATLAVRKVTYRALLQPILEEALRLEAARRVDDGTGETPENRRLGKLPDAAYADWDTFLARAGEKVGLRWGAGACVLSREMESRVAVLHVLRCLLGPVVESLILLDREAWVREALGGEMGVELVNLFDQGTGSGRNVGLVVFPKP